MKVNFDDPNPGIWLDIDENNPEEGRICLRVMSTAKERELDRKYSKKKSKVVKGRIHDTVDIDWPKRDREFWDYVIVDWENIRSENDVEIPATAENKLFLMEKNPDFQEFISDMLEKLREQKEERKKATEKN